MKNKNKKTRTLLILIGIALVSLILGTFGRQPFFAGLFGGTIALAITYALLPKDWSFKQTIGIDDSKYDERQRHIQGKVYAQNFGVLSIGLVLLGILIDEGMLTWIRPGHLLAILGMLSITVCSIVLISKDAWLDVSGSLKIVFPILGATDLLGWLMIIFYQEPLVKNAALTERGVAIIVMLLLSSELLAGLWAVRRESKKSIVENEGEEK
jgi:hypothetical protein